MESRFRNLIIIVLSLSILLSIGYSNGGRTSVTIVENIASYVIVPTQEFLMGLSNSITNRVNDISKVFEYRDTIESLEKENRALKAENIKLTLKQDELNALEDLKSQLSYVKRNEFDAYVTADVVSKSHGNWFDMFTINAGTNQGIAKYSVVMTGNGLVGKVYEVGNNYAKVISIVDQKSKISFKILSTTLNYEGFIESAHNGLLSGSVFEPNATLKEGMSIITTGQGSYPEGILIGKIIEVIDDKDAFLKRITIEPSVNFKSIEKVIVATMNEERSEWIDED